MLNFPYLGGEINAYLNGGMDLGYPAYNSPSTNLDLLVPKLSTLSYDSVSLRTKQLDKRHITLKELAMYLGGIVAASFALVGTAKTLKAITCDGLIGGMGRGIKRMFLRK